MIPYSLPLLCQIACQAGKLSLDLQKLLIWFEYQNWLRLLRGEAVQTFTGWLP